MSAAPSRTPPVALAPEHPVDTATAPTGWLNRGRWWAMLLFTAVYLPLTLERAAVKPMWEDELFTLAISRQPWPEMYRALVTGADQHPLPFYVLTHAALATGLRTEIAIRLPEIVAGWIAALAVFLYLARVLDVIYALLGVLCLMTTAVWGYATEARGYELMVAGCAVAFLAWQAVGRRRGAALGLAAALMAAVASHYYAVLVVAPFAVAEGWRTWTRGERRPIVWLAFAAALVPLGLSLSLVRAGRSYADTFWGKPSFQGVGDSYLFLLSSAALALAPVVALGAWSAIGAKAEPVRRVPIRRDELVALLGLVALPLLGVLVGKLATGAFAARYMLPAAVGLAILAAIALYGLFQGRAAPALSAAFMLAACLLYVGMMWVSLDHQSAQRQAALGRWIATAGHEELPIVVAQPNAFLSLAQYAPAPVAGRLVFLGDTTEAQRYLRQDTAERGFTDLAPWFPRTVLSYAALRRRNREALLFADWTDFGIRNWVVSRLLDDGARFELIGRNRDAQLFHVWLPDSARAGAVTNPAM
ncbi:MAG: hypothetical protein ACTHM9_01570 [Gemmatimonadales bacterium]